MFKRTAERQPLTAAGLRVLRLIGASAGLALLCTVQAGCNRFSSYGLNVTKGPTVPPQMSFNVVGTPNTPFTAIISDTQSSWPVTGATPLAIYMINEQTPVRIIAAKTVDNDALISLQILAANTSLDAISTTQGFRSLSVQAGGTLAQFAPPAGVNEESRDVRFFVRGPAGGLFTALIEDESVAYQTQALAPALFLFPNSKGTVDGLFTLIFPAGSFAIDLIVNGHIVKTGTGAPTITVK